MSSPLGGQPRPPMFDGSGNFTAAWAGWFSIVQYILQDQSNSGPTTQRPTTNQYVGKTYFDTTLGKPIWIKTGGSPPTWVDATGAPV